MSKSPDFTVYYYVCGICLSPHRVRISYHSDIEDLRWHVAADYSTLIDREVHLTLYKVEKFWFVEDKEKLADKVSQLFDEHKPVQLYLVQTMEQAFGDASLTHYVIVKVELTTASSFTAKGEEVVALARRNYMSHPDGAKQRNVAKIQKKANKTAQNSRLPRALTGFPIVAGHPVFSLFMSIVNGSLAEKPLTSAELNLAVDFREIFFETYGDDLERRKKIRKTFDSIGQTAAADDHLFSPGGRVEIRLSPPGQGALTTMVYFLELKNETRRICPFAHSREGEAAAGEAMGAVAPTTLTAAPLLESD
ncbi:hypothetical protein BC629DRAFT_1000772 [Irpex lacteus]|nr:hypothetical protein BC629DRAFT_1000772 [Irpex lacteus]